MVVVVVVVVAVKLPKCNITVNHSVSFLRFAARCVCIYFIFTDYGYNVNPVNSGKQEPITKIGSA